MTNRRTRLHLALEILCFALLFALVLCVIPLSAEEAAEGEEAQTPKTVNVVKVLKDIPRGTWIDEKDLEIVEVKNVNVPANVISDIEEVVDKCALADIYAGEYVAKYLLSDVKVGKLNDDVLKKEITKSNSDYVVVTDYVIPGTGDDLSHYLQEIINKNPKRTIYFPDGEYTIASPIMTSAGGGTSVDIQLADGAVIKAHANWKANDGINSLISLGGAKHVNNIVDVGSYYTLVGGTLDGNNRANGVSIDSGRESCVRNLCIKNCIIGVMVEKGANNVSSDCDFEDITIIGNPNEFRQTYGFYVIGYDNTFTNLRIYNVTTGFHSQGAGNFLKSIYVDNTGYGENINRKSSVGISGPVDNRYSQCFVEDCVTAYNISSGSLIWDCTASWTDPECAQQNAIKTGSVKLALSGIKAYFIDSSAPKNFIQGVSEGTAPKTVEGCIFDPSKLGEAANKVYSGYLKTDVIVPIS